jgi:hypothetical protein
MIGTAMRRGTSLGALVIGAWGLAAGAAIAGCGIDEPRDVSTGFGATVGPLTISGHLRDPAGNNVVGGRVALDGDTHAVRLSNFTGGFAFHVEPGMYQLSVSGDCGFPSTPLRLREVTASATLDVAAANTGCVTSTVFDPNVNGEMLKIDPIGSYTAVNVGSYADADRAVASFDDIASEVTDTPIRRVIIAGHPALERLASIWHSGPQGVGPGSTMLYVETAIAVGDQVVRFSTQLQPDAAVDTIDRFLDAGRSFTPDQIPELHAPSSPP